MKRIGYAVWLPLVHVVIMAPLIALEEAKGWKYLPVQQRIEDYEKVHPQKPKPSKDPASDIGWDPYYEYRPSISVMALYTVEFPATLLFSWCGHPPGPYSFTPLYNETWCRLFRFIRVRTRIVILDLLLLAGIYAQWWFVGRRLDWLHLQGRPKSLIKVTALLITLAGALAALLSHGPAFLDLIAALACFLAFLRRLLLILEATTAFSKLAFQHFQGGSASA